MNLRNKKPIFINFNKTYCLTSIEILNSKQFKRILDAFISHLNRQNFSWWEELKNSVPSNQNINDEILIIFKLILVFKKDEIVNPLIERNLLLYRFVNEFYDYWRNFERYATYMFSNGGDKGVDAVNFLESYTHFNEVVLLTYRRISEALVEQKNLVYRQLSAGYDVGIVLKENQLTLPSKYLSLQKVPIINSVIFNPPFIAYTLSSTRNGVFSELTFNPIEESRFSRREWFCYPIKVGNSLAFVYFHRLYTNIGVSLANLFEPAREEEYLYRKPDIIYIHGGSNELVNESSFYIDKEENIYVGYSPFSEDVTYFGYLKKMLLTLHNLKMIDEGELPLHGAMVSIEFKNNVVKNIVLVGDSGAGKSETVEAFRIMAKDRIKNLNIIFDDMGSLGIKNGQVVGYGTEIGAFVRLDDLDTGYAYKKIDRAIFLNPDKSNARTVIPTTLYEDVIKGYKVDMILYANNYEDKEGIEFFDDVEEAKKVFTKGKRKAIGTTGEKGLVSTFFANPFGPCQRKEKTITLIDYYFNFLKTNNIPIGVIYTQLGFEDKKESGPMMAADILLRCIEKLEKS